MKSGSLSKMTYPTGGYSLFEYDPHLNTVTEDITNYVNENASLSVLSGSGTTVTDFIFTLPANAMDLSWSWNLVPGNYDDNMFGYLMRDDIILHQVNGNGFSNLNHQGTLTVPPDNQYKLRINRANVNDAGSIFISWKRPITTQVTEEKIVFGGLRIKNIKHYNNVNELQGESHYNYNSLVNPNYSTAILPPNAFIQYHSQVRAGRTLLDYPDPPASSNMYLCGYDVISSTTIPILGNGLDASIGYHQVVETQNDNGNGRSIYTYTISSGDLGITTGTNGNEDWCKGMLRIKLDQKNEGQNYINVKKIENFYNTSFDQTCYTNPGNCQVNQSVIPNKKIVYERQEFIVEDGVSIGVDAILPAIFIVENYLTNVTPVYLYKTEETIYEPSGINGITTSSHYFYENSTHTYPTRVEVVSSKNITTRTEKKYPIDLAAPNGSTPNIYNEMVAANIISPIVQVRVLKAGNEILKTSMNYQRWNDAVILPLSHETALNGNAPSVDLVFNNYDSRGNILQFRERDGITKSYIWDYNQFYPIAQVLNGTFENCAYTSFETNGKGNWSFSGTPSTHTSPPTGLKVYVLNGSNAITKAISSSQTYIVSYWRNSSTALSIPGTVSGSIKIGRNVGGWWNIEHKITGQTTLTISGSGSIDELRLYPLSAQMTTYTYDPLIGMTSQCDPNNTIVYSEYDAFGRLKLLRDQNRKIVKTFQYQYQQTQ